MAVAVGVIEAQVEEWAPRFAGDPLLATYAAAAQRRHNEASFTLGATPGGNPSIYVDAMSCWVLHWLTLAELEAQGLGGAAGPLTAIRTGDESVAFQQGSVSGGGGLAPSDLHFLRTSWGQRYLTYRNSRPDAHMTVV